MACYMDMNSNLKDRQISLFWVAQRVIIAALLWPAVIFADSIDFIALGDWGVKGSQTQKQVAGAMSQYALNNPSQFIVTCGDNFYGSGVRSVEDEHWTKSWSNVYALPGISKLKWYVSLGNHDYQGNVSAQIEFSKTDPRWVLPRRFYRRQFLSGNVTADFYFIDTTPFITSYSGNSMPDLAAQRKRLKIQKRWLRNKAKNSTADWKIAIGHHPLYSSTPGREAERVDMRNSFQQIFKRQKIHMYIAGHDHDLQLLKNPELLTFQIISGGGQSARPVVQNPFHLFVQSSPGFAALKLRKNTFQVEYVNQNAESLFVKNYRKLSR